MNRECCLLIKIVSVILSIIGDRFRISELKIKQKHLALTWCFRGTLDCSSNIPHLKIKRDPNQTFTLREEILAKRNFGEFGELPEKFANFAKFTFRRNWIFLSFAKINSRQIWFIFDKVFIYPKSAIFYPFSAKIFNK